jgi:predicted phage terminase large subunit-like protein
MSKIHRSPCPLCLNLVPTSHIDVAGCPTCADERTLLRRSYVEVRLPKIDVLEEKSAVRYKKFVAHNKEIAARREEKAEQKLRDEEKQRIAAIHREEASVSLAKRSLLHYIERRMFSYKPNWAHELIASYLEKFMQDIADKKHPRLIIVCTSRLGKSELASNSFPAFLLGHHPSWNILLASASDALPTEFSRNIREQIRSEDYRRIFPKGATLRPDSTAALRWQTQEGGGLKAIGAGGTLLGFGAECIILDDIATPEQMENPDRNRALWDWYSSVAVSRQNPGCGILVIAQRLHDQDLIGRLLTQQRENEERVKELRKDARDLAEESPNGMDDPIVQSMIQEADELDDVYERWEVVEFPALARLDEYWSDDKREIVRYPPGTNPDLPNLRPLRKAGEAIHPERYSRAYYLRIKKGNPRMFSAMFQLDPISDEGAYFDYKVINRYEPNERPKLETMQVVVAWDLAISSKQSADYTVGVVLARDFKKRIWVLDMMRGRFSDIRVVIDHIIDLHLRWNADISGVESSHMEKVMAPLLQARMQERGDFINLAQGREKLVALSDKATRARTLQGWVNAGQLYVPSNELYDDMISEMSRFPVGAHDDIVDALAWSAILLNRTAAPTDPREENRKKRREEDRWLEDLSEFVNGYSSNTYMES